MEKVLLNDVSKIDNFEDFIVGDKKGTITLAAPMLNIYEWKNICSYATGIKEQDIEKIVYYAAVVIDDPGESGKQKGTVLDITEYDTLKSQYKDMTVKRGAEAIELLLSQININEKFAESRKKEQECMAILEELGDPENDEPGSNKEEKRIKTLKILRTARKTIDSLYYIRKKKCKLSIREINVFPLHIRAILKEELKNNLYEMDFLARLYERVIMQNNRLRKLQSIEAPQIILINESRMLQERIDQLYANGKRGEPVLLVSDDDRSVLPSLANIIMRNLLS